MEGTEYDEGHAAGYEEGFADGRAAGYCAGIEEAAKVAEEYKPDPMEGQFFTQGGIVAAIRALIDKKD